MCSLSIETLNFLSTIGKATADYDALAARGLKLDRTARALRLVTPLALAAGSASPRPPASALRSPARAHRDLSGGTDLHRRAVEPDRRIDSARVGEDDDSKPLGAVRDDPRSLDGAACAKGCAERRCERHRRRPAAGSRAPRTAGRAALGAAAAALPEARFGGGAPVAAASSSRAASSSSRTSSQPSRSSSGRESSAPRCARHSCTNSFLVLRAKPNSVT